MFNLSRRLCLLSLIFSGLCLALTINAHAKFGLPKIPKGLPMDLGSSKQESSSKKSDSDTAGKGLSLLSTAMSSQGDDEEIAAGDAVTALYLGAAPLVQNEAVASYVQSLGTYIAAQTERSELPWAFGVIDSPTVNAFAAPGGKVLLTSGLFNMLDSEDQLATVLGHEIAHVVLQHHWKIIKKQKLISGVADIAVSEVDAGSGASEAAFNALEGIIRQSILSGIDRGGEFEADQHGIRYAAIAGYNCASAFGVLQSLAVRAAGSGADVSFLYKTHPTAEKRINELAEILISNPSLEDVAVDSVYAQRILQYQALLEPTEEASASDSTVSGSMLSSFSYCGLCNAH
ncbi:MAG TPA: peptidase [Opitutae bacterium]|jgi:predicted Zn-dependent protease|nr:peptidase [Opitutae bacterium]